MLGNIMSHTRRRSRSRSRSRSREDVSLSRRPLVELSLDPGARYNRLPPPPVELSLEPATEPIYNYLTERNEGLNRSLRSENRTLKEQFDSVFDRRLMPMLRECVEKTTYIPMMHVVADYISIVLKYFNFNLDRFDNVAAQKDHIKRPSDGTFRHIFLRKEEVTELFHKYKAVEAIIKLLKRRMFPHFNENYPEQEDILDETEIDEIFKDFKFDHIGGKKHTRRRRRSKQFK